MVKSKLVILKWYFTTTFKFVCVCVCVDLIKNQMQSVVYDKLVLVTQYHPGWPPFSISFPTTDLPVLFW